MQSQGNQDQDQEEEEHGYGHDGHDNDDWGDEDQVSYLLPPLITLVMSSP